MHANKTMNCYVYAMTEAIQGMVSQIDHWYIRRIVFVDSPHTVTIRNLYASFYAFVSQRCSYT